MKKLFFIAALAGVALVSCTKNEVAPSVQQDEITFAAPVVGSITKASEVKGTIFPETMKFNAWAWYHEGTGAFTSAGATGYMEEVTVEHVSGDVITDDSGTGGWHANPAYYWPKNGLLTFDAYAPHDLETTGTCSVTSTAAEGLTITDYTVPSTIANQIDVMYSTRAYDKTKSSHTDGGYDGVDILFNHALSVIAIKAAAADATAASVVRIKNIRIESAFNKGTFKQNHVNGYGGTPTWTPVTDSKETYYVVGSSTTDHATATTIATGDPVQKGENLILLPQVFTTSGAKITVDYFIQNGGSTGPVVEQTYTLELSGTDHKDSSDAQITSWEMGKRYTYSIVIGVNEIYIAPSISTDWVNVNSSFPAI